jgi:hypothetical protein
MITIAVIITLAFISCSSFDYKEWLDKRGVPYEPCQCRYCIQKRWLTKIEMENLRTIREAHKLESGPYHQYDWND